VPVYNGERFLAEALDSILAQSYRPLEVIVVDDGSTDGTRDVATSYGSRIAYLSQPNAGSAGAKNSGIRAASGELVAFLDADDVWLPDKLLRQWQWSRERSDLFLCLTRFESFWMPELAEEEERLRNDPIAAPSSSWSICTLLTPRAAFDHLGLFGEGLRGNENLLWFISAARAGATIKVLPHVLVRRRFHQSNDTRASQAHVRDLFLPIVRAWRDYKRTGTRNEE
jgi:glycosyltransferase involved in cell wall biosynthesis